MKYNVVHRVPGASKMGVDPSHIMGGPFDTREEAYEFARKGAEEQATKLGRTEVVKRAGGYTIKLVIAKMNIHWDVKKVL